MNVGGRVREEIFLTPELLLVLGLGGEYSELQGQLRTRVAADNYRIIPFNRNFGNIAPEVALVYNITPDINTHVRFANGYGIPNFGNLTTGPNGLPGNNTALQAQTNYGFDVGVDAKRLANMLDLGVTGYYEFFSDEFNTVSPGAGLSSFTTNAPAAEHRGIEAYALFRPFRDTPWWEGLYLRTAYTYNDHYYTHFTETVNGRRFDRDGKQIPGVERHFLNTKLGYETPWHVGAYLELNYFDHYYINNSNTLRAPGYHVLNANIHYGGVFDSFMKGLEAFFEVRNLLDSTYAESAVTVSDDVVNSQFSLENKQAFFAGAPRSFYGGVRFRF